MDLYSAVSTTRSEMLKTLKRHAVEQFGAVGDKSDPNLHQTLFQAATPDKEPGISLQLSKEGHHMSGRILWPAQVGVVKEAE
jgi:molecular chaperone GrpE